jgi:putative transcriptional regulator
MTSDLHDFAPGPGGVASEAVLIRMAAGATFPRHSHLGREVGCVLEGALLLDGRVYHPGDIVVSEAGTAHELTAGPACDLVMLVAHSGVRFG